MARTLDERLEQMEWRLKRLETKLQLEPLVELPPKLVTAPSVPIATPATPPPLPRAVGNAERLTPSPGNPGGAGVRGLKPPIASPHPNPLPAYREREQRIQPLSYDSPKPKKPQ